MNKPKRSIVFKMLCGTTAIVSLLFVFSPACSLAQQINVQTPLNTVNNSFFSRNGVNFGFGIPGGRGNGSRIVGLNPQGQLTPNLNFTQNGFGGAVPAFGGFDPGAGARFGFSNFNRNGGGFSLGFDFNQGSSRSSVSQVPSITVPNGFGGSIRSGANRPFVTGVTPVVSSGGVTLPKYIPIPERPRNAVTDAVQSGQLSLSDLGARPAPRPTGPTNYSVENSSAQSSDIGVAAIRAQRASAEQAELAEAQRLIRGAKDYETRGDYRMARVNLRDAIKRVSDRGLKSELRARLESLRGR